MNGLSIVVQKIYNELHNGENIDILKALQGFDRTRQVLDINYISVWGDGPYTPGYIAWLKARNKYAALNEEQTLRFHSITSSADSHSCFSYIAIISGLFDELDNPKKKAKETGT